MKMKKPIMKSGMFGLKGNKWKAYDVTVDGRIYNVHIAPSGTTSITPLPVNRKKL